MRTRPPRLIVDVYLKVRHVHELAAHRLVERATDFWELGAADARELNQQSAARALLRPLPLRVLLFALRALLGGRKRTPTRRSEAGLRFCAPQAGGVEETVVKACKNLSIKILSLILLLLLVLETFV